MRRLLPLTALVLAFAALPVLAQSGLRTDPQDSGTGLTVPLGAAWGGDFAFGAERLYLPEPLKLLPETSGYRYHWSYSLKGFGSVGMSLSPRGGSDELSPVDTSEVSIFGAYSFAPRWSVSAEAAASADPADPLKRPTLRLGLRHRF